MQDEETPTISKQKVAWEEAHERALRRFDLCATSEAMEMRALARQARRFAAIPGAQWEGEWGEQFEAGFRVSVNKVTRGLRKIETDYRENRIIPDFRPAGGESNQDTASMLDGVHRADSYHFNAQQARDNAFNEAIRGGFGAYRLTNVLDDPSDKNNDHQRVNPGRIITDADQCVFFDPDSRLYDKSDAKYAFVVETHSKEGFEEVYGEDCIADWPEVSSYKAKFDWFSADGVRVAEYYEVQDKREKLHILSHSIAQGEERYWDSEISADDLADKQAAGWQVKTERRERKRIAKYIMSGAEVIEQQEVAGDCIPIVPVYGQREFIDGMEYFKGHVQDRMDSQRVYNAQVSKLAGAASESSSDKPIFTPEQMPPVLAEHWSRHVIDRAPYLLVNPLLDKDGNILSPGPIGSLPAPQVPPQTAALLQIANNDLLEDDQDGAEQIRSNVSAEAMDIAATRVDAKSGIYLDNMRQSVQREGQIYLAMAREVYFEPGRELETMSEDGGDGVAILAEDVTDKATGAVTVRNDLARGKYKVVASVTEATATRRDKTVRSSLSTAEVALSAGDNELAQAAILTAVMNQDGEGIDDLHRYARQRALAIGLVEPNDEEKAAMEQANENAQPDPASQLAISQAKQLEQQGEKDAALAEKAAADADLARAKTAEIITGIGQPDRPVIRMGRDLVN